MNGPSLSSRHTVSALRAAVCALAITGCGCFSVYVAPAVAEPETAVSENAGPVVRSPAIVAFYCYGHTVWGRAPLYGCDELKSVASRMIAGALPQSATGAEPRDLLEISVERQGDPLPQPLAFFRGLAGFVTEMASPVTVSSEARWTLEVSVTSTSAAATRRYETAAFETGGVLPIVSLPSPPRDARLILRDSKKSRASLLNPQAEAEIVRSLVAAFIVEADPSVCATVEESPTIAATTASLSDREVIEAACTKLRLANRILARRPIPG